MADLDFSEFEPADPDLAGDGGSGAPALAIAFAEPGGGERRYRLLAPLVVNDERLDEITLRLPTQSDLDDFANGELGNRRLLLARLAGLDPLVIKALAWPDSQAVHQMFADILPDFLKE